MAHSYWKKGDYQQANSYLENLLSRNQITPSIDRQEIEWNRVLLLLINNGAEDSKFNIALDKIINNTQHGYNKQAVVLSSRINSFWRRFSSGAHQSPYRNKGDK